MSSNLSKSSNGAKEGLSSAEKKSLPGAGRGSSPQWKEHYSKISKIWGDPGHTPAKQQDSRSRSELWQRVRNQKEKGGYPWTHLTHNQDKEIWIDPLSLPSNISNETIRRKEIPREWFHLPDGVEPPSVLDLLEESPPEEPDQPSIICGRGRSRSKSKEKKLQKRSSKRESKKVPSEPQKPLILQHPGPPVPPKFIKSREPHPLPTERDPVEDDGEYELDTRRYKRTGRSGSRDARSKSVKSTPQTPRVQKQKPDDGGYEPVGRKRRSFNPFASRDHSRSQTKIYEELDKSDNVNHPSSSFIDDEEEKRRVNEGTFTEIKEKSTSIKNCRTPSKPVSNLAPIKGGKKDKRPDKSQENGIDLLTAPKEETESPQNSKKERIKAARESKDRKEETKDFKNKGAKNVPETVKVSIAHKNTEDKLPKSKESENGRLNGSCVDGGIDLKEDRVSKYISETPITKQPNGLRKNSDVEAVHLVEKIKGESFARDPKDKDEVIKNKETHPSSFVNQEEKGLIKKKDTSVEASDSKKNDKMDILKKLKDGKKKKEDDKDLEGRTFYGGSGRRDKMEEEEESQPTESSKIVITDRKTFSKMMEGGEVDEPESSERIDESITKADSYSFMEHQHKTASPEIPDRFQNGRDLEKELYNPFNNDDILVDDILQDDDTLEQPLSKKELKKAEKARKKAQKVEKDKVIKEEKAQMKMEKIQIEKEKKDLVKFEKERKRAEKDRIKAEKEESKRNKTEKKKPNRFLFKITQNKAKSLSDLNENDPLVIKEYDLEYDRLEEEPNDGAFETVKFGQTHSDQLDSTISEGNLTRGNIYEPISKKDPVDELLSEDSCKKEPVDELLSEDTSKKEPVDEAVPPRPSHREESPKPDLKKEEKSKTMSSKFSKADSSAEDDFAKFQNQALPPANQPIPDEEEIDFTPQNGYVLDERAMEDLGYIAVDEDEEETKKSQRKSRERRNFKLGLHKSVSNFNNKIRNARLPSPHELKEGYKNSDFHKSFKQPLLSRTRVEVMDVQKARALIVEHNTPLELAKMKHPLDIPLPKFGGGENKPLKPKQDNKPEENGSVSEDRPPSRGGKIYKTLPKSWRETQLITSVKENEDPELLAFRQELVKTKTPGELAQLHSITDFPVPTRLTNLFTPPPQKECEDKDRRKGQSDTSINKPKEPFKIEEIIPKSIRETKLVTNVKETEDDDVIKERQALVREKTPGELAHMSGFGDFPVPTRIEKIFKQRSRSTSGSRINKERRSSTTSKRSHSLTRSLSGTIPKSWRETQLLTGIKMSQNPEETARRRALIESKSPAELSKITSVADLPVPTPLQNIFRGGNKTEDEPSEDRGSARKLNLEEMYNNLPRSLKMELLVKSVESDQELTKKRQKLVESMKPKDLSQIGSLSEFPVPSVLENIFKEKDPTATPSPEKRARNKTVIGLMSYENLPDSLKREYLVRTKQEEDQETLKERRDAVASKTPNELSQMSSLSDFPLPTRIESVVRPSRRNLRSTKQKDMEKKRSKSWSSLTNPKELYKALPQSLKSQVLVNVKVQDPEIIKERQALIKDKSVTDLSEIHGFSDFPIPSKIEDLIRSDPNKQNDSRPETPARSLKESVMSAVPDSLRTEVLVRARNEDPETQRLRQELTRSKTPNELSQMSSVYDFPIPTSVENLFKKKETDGDEPVPPPRRFKKENLYESLPDSLKCEVLVRTKAEEDDNVLRERQELVRSKSPAELSEIHGLEDFPIPSIFTKKSKKDEEEKVLDEEVKDKSLYSSIPDSLKKEVMVRSVVEKPHIQKERAEVAQNNSVSELSMIHGFSDFPLPTNIEYAIGRKPRPVERRKKFREKQRSQSAKNLHERMYDTLPQSLKSEILVKSRLEDPILQQERARLVQSKSVGELSQIHSLSDFPIPTTLGRLVSREERRNDGECSSKRTSFSNLSSLSRKNLYSALPKSLTTQDCLVRTRLEDPEILKRRRDIVQSKSVSELATLNSLSDFPVPANIERFIQNRRAKSVDQSRTEGRETSEHSRATSPIEKLRDSIPDSLKTEVLVRSRVEDPEISKKRKEITERMSVSELSQVKGISDFPVPTTLENLMKGRNSRNENRPEDDNQGETGHVDLYASLPRSLKTEVLVRSVVKEEDDEIKKRQALTETKTPSELSQIHSFSEIPIPSRIEAWLSSNDETKLGHPVAPPRTTRSFHELRENMYDNLPKSLKEPTLVRSKVEDPEIQKNRVELTRSKTPSQLSEIRSINEIPIPGLWDDGSQKKRSGSLGDLSGVSLPKSKQEIKEYVYKTFFPEALVRPCIVRSKIENKDRLFERQAIQQSKSIHELSKIKNLSDFPLPGNIKLPPIPLPSTKGILKKIAPTRKTPKKPEDEVQSLEHQYNLVDDGNFDNSVITDDEMLRYDASTPGGSIAREQDFGYEVIAATNGEKGEDSTIPNLSQVLDQFRNDLIPQEERSPDKNVINEEEENEVDSQLIDQYKGTPPRALGRSKIKNKKNRQSQELSERPKKSSPSLPVKNDYCLPFPETASRWMPLHEYQVELPIDKPLRASPRRVIVERYSGDMSPQSNDLPFSHLPRELSYDEMVSNDDDDMFYVAGIPPPTSSFPSQPPPPELFHISEYSEVNKDYLLEKGTQFPPIPAPRKRRQDPPHTYISPDLIKTTSSYDEIQPHFNDEAPRFAKAQGEHVVERIQSRPLPAPPTPVRSRGQGKNKRPETPECKSSATNTEVFHTVQSTLDATLVDSKPSYDGDDETLADSVVDSMHSCAETLIDEDSTLHEDFPNEDVFLSDHTPRSGSVEERLKTETQELSRELLEHVENLRTTLGNMSSRLGTASPEPASYS